MNAPIAGAENLFPLHTPEHAAPVPERPAGASRPFGLRYLTQPASTMPVDFSNWDYDPERQIAIVHDHGKVIEAARHSNGPTQTPSGKQDAQTKYERDNDQTED